MNVLFWEWRDFQVSFSGRDMSRNVWNRSSGSSMVDMGISSNIMKYPSPKCYMIFLDMIIYNDTLHWSDISLNRDLLNKLDIITVFGVITLLWGVSIWHLQQLQLANRRRLLLRTPDPVLYGTCICSNFEKKKEIWLSPMTKAPTPTVQYKIIVTTQTTSQKTLITQQIRTDLGRLVGVTTATPLVWLNRFSSAQPSY